MAIKAFLAVSCPYFDWLLQNRIEGPKIFWIGEDTVGLEPAAQRIHKVGLLAQKDKEIRQFVE